jgi:hypothetical protein
MKNLPIFTLIILLPISLFAQGLLPGIITHQNSGNKPIPGVYVESELGGGQKTAADGTFLMKFPGKYAGFVIKLDKVEKEGLEVVNKKELIVTLKKDQSKRLKLYMCPKGQWYENAMVFLRD